VTRLLAAIACAALLACSDGSEPAAPAPGGCPASHPVECRDPAGAIAACCPSDHPICAADGTACAAASDGGGATGGMGATGGNAATAGTGAAGAGSAGVDAAGGSAGAPGGQGGAAGEAGAAASGGAAGTAGKAGAGAGAGAGGAGAGGTSGAGAIAGCDDVGFEPNDDEASATDLPDVTDCDVTGSQIGAALDGAEGDFYRFSGADVSGCVVDPIATTGDAVRLCLYAECAGLALSCTQGAAASSPAGRAGCCVHAGGTVELFIDCSGWSEDATIWIGVEQSGEACLPYSVEYHY
jgi:hypothetical protein